VHLVGPVTLIHYDARSTKHWLFIVCPGFLQTNFGRFCKRIRDHFVSSSLIIWLIIFLSTSKLSNRMRTLSNKQYINLRLDRVRLISVKVISSVFLNLDQQLWDPDVLYNTHSLYLSPEAGKEDFKIIPILAEFCQSREHWAETLLEFIPKPSLHEMLLHRIDWFV
jgi:hypothetical protein